MNLLTLNHFYQRYKLIVNHSLGWLLYIGYEQSILLVNPAARGNLSATLCYYCLNILLFYVHCYVLGRTAGRTRPAYLAAVALTLAELTMFVLAKSLLAKLLFGSSVFHWESWRSTALLDTFRSLYFIVMATLFWTAVHMDIFRRVSLLTENRRLTAEREKLEAQAKLQEAESAYYQLQLNPHLLLNTLAFVHHRVAQHSEEGARGVLLLSEILRYSLQQTDAGGTASLEDELQQLRNLVEINRLRFGDNFAVELQISPTERGLALLPLILLSLAENLFKHGLVNEPAYPAFIRISLAPGNVLHYTSHNRKKSQASQPKHDGLGLKNCRLRLEQAYPGRYQLDIRDNEQEYDVKLTIAL